MPEKFGELHVIYGSMFSGKTKFLINEINVLRISGRQVLLFKPKIDNRYSNNSVVSHDDDSAEAICIDSPYEVYKFTDPEVDIIAFDEGQFFDRQKLEEVVEHLLSVGHNVYVAGLATDFRGEGFGAMPKLIAVADHAYHRKAVCEVCKKRNATRTQRLINAQPAPYDSPQIQVGGTDSYEARCREHHVVPNHN